VCAAKHWAFQHLEAIDMSLNGASTPGERHPRFDGGVVIPEPCGKALHRRQGTRGSTVQPGIELRRLPLADQRGEILGEVDRLRDLGRLRAQLDELLRLGLGALRFAP
jgi:hypothetical protein